MQMLIERQNKFKDKYLFFKKEEKINTYTNKPFSSLFRFYIEKLSRKIIEKNNNESYFELNIHKRYKTV